jgi:acetylornithine deacetylase/succinyl-diaminopimelate desuccinylase family protein
MTETTRLLCDLVRIPSINPMGRKMSGPEVFEHRLTAYLEDFFRGLGVPCERQTIAPLRDNIIARWDIGSARTLLLEVHQDTVPVDHMTVEPFGAVIENGRLYGRGACDIKGGMAAMLAAFARLVKEKPASASNVILACTVDEEHTFLGVQELVRRGIRADMAIAAEPTQLDIVHAHKGVCRWDITTPGRACHSSAPEQGVNAIYRMGRLLVAIERYAATLRTTRIDPLLGPATISVGRIEGGASANTVPERCRIEIDRRVVPGEDPLAAPEQLAAFLMEEAGIDFPFQSSEPWINAPALGTDQHADIVLRLGQAIDAVRGAHRVLTVPYGTDASTIATAGIPSVVFGPGDIAKAHTCDEWVPLDEVEQAAEIFYRFACTN